MCAHHLYYMHFKILSYVVNDILFNMAKRGKTQFKPVASKFTHFLLIETSEAKCSNFSK